MSRIKREKGKTSPVGWVFTDQEKPGVYYQRIKAGAVLQGPKGGAIAVVGEQPTIRDETSQLSLIGIGTAPDLPSIFRVCQRMAVDLRYDELYAADAMEPAVQHFLDLYNRQQREKRAPILHVMEPLNQSSGLSYYLSVLSQALEPSQCRLDLGSFERDVKGALAAINGKEATQGNLCDHPVPASLAIAVASMIESPFNMNQERQSRGPTDPMHRMVYGSRESKKPNPFY